MAFPEILGCSPFFPRKSAQSSVSHPPGFYASHRGSTFNADSVYELVTWLLVHMMMRKAVLTACRIPV